MLADLDDAAADVYHHVRGEPHPAPMLDADRLSLIVHVEQAPDPENRVTLGDERDALGLPRARLRWGLGALERRTVERVSRLIAEEFGRLALGRLRYDDWLLAPDAAWPSVSIKCHHIGTTRMSDDPRRGVVDRECRVHGIENLWIAGKLGLPDQRLCEPHAHDPRADPAPGGFAARSLPEMIRRRDPSPRLGCPGRSADEAIEFRARWPGARAAIASPGAARTDCMIGRLRER